MSEPIHPAQEGVIRFRADHHEAPLDEDALAAQIRALVHCRDRLHDAGLVGQDPARYEGAGYGNVSVRLPDAPDADGARAFLVSGTQTGGIPRLRPEHLCVVDRYVPAENRVESHGPILPSSESMTHGVLYDAVPQAGSVVHVHSPELWGAAGTLGLPVTPAEAGYGTPEMCAAVRRILQADPEARVLAMGGHEDGVLAFGASAEEASRLLLALLDA